MEGLSLDLWLGFDSELGQTNDFQIGIHSFPSWRLALTGTVWRTSRQVYVLCCWERHLAGFPHLGVVDRRLATPKQARTALWSLSRDRKINMEVNIKNQLRITDDESGNLFFVLWTSAICSTNKIEIYNWGYFQLYWTENPTVIEKDCEVSLCSLNQQPTQWICQMQSAPAVNRWIGARHAGST